MIFIIKEQCMNGTVTMYIKVYGIEAASFQEAKDKIRSMTTLLDADFQDDGDECLSYSVGGVFGSMDNEPLKMLA